MSRPGRQPAAGPQLPKAPSTGHPARQAEPVEDTPSSIVPPPARQPRKVLVNFGGRVQESTRKRIRVYAAEHDLDLQDILDEALIDWADRHGA